MTARARPCDIMHHWSSYLALAILAVEREARSYAVSRNNARLRILRRIEIRSLPAPHMPRDLATVLALIAIQEKP